MASPLGCGVDIMVQRRDGADYDAPPQRPLTSLLPSQVSTLRIQSDQPPRFIIYVTPPAQRFYIILSLSIHRLDFT